jgi:starch-binding outer membrane protein SusE/F
LATPFADPAQLRTANTTVTGTLVNAAAPSNTFDWQSAFKGYSGAVTYTLQYDSAGKNFVVPIEIAVGTSILTKGLTQGEMNETALASGITAGATGKVEYRIKSVTAGGATAFSNVVTVIINTYIPITRVYLPGGYQSSTGNGNNWDPPTAPELIRDQRASVNNKMYYTYIFLPANAEFKITIGRTWDVNYGGSGGNLSGSGPNLSVATAGYYRISVNIATLKYDIRIGRMGFVGGSTPTGWTPPNVFPTNAMANAGKNLFIGVSTFTNGGGWKLIDNDQWDSGSQLVDETRSYGSTGGDGSTLAVNGSNFNDFATPGRYRVIWDGRDVNNVKYNFSPATEMRVVGNGMTGVPDWNPGASPQMTYAGNGVWTRTLVLDANEEIKFLAGNDWGAFDYEDNSGQSQATGVAKKIQWENGPNFRTPTTAGTYTITLNENTQTVTIN